MKPSDPNWDEYTVREHLRLVSYWRDRFDSSGDIDHLDNAERHAEIVRAYLPEHLQDLNVLALRTLYQYSPSLSEPRMEERR